MPDPQTGMPAADSAQKVASSFESTCRDTRRGKKSPGKGPRLPTISRLRRADPRSRGTIHSKPCNADTVFVLFCPSQPEGHRINRLQKELRRLFTFTTPSMSRGMSPPVSSRTTTPSAHAMRNAKWPKGGACKSCTVATPPEKGEFW